MSEPPTNTVTPRQAECYTIAADLIASRGCYGAKQWLAAFEMENTERGPATWRRVQEIVEAQSCRKTRVAIVQHLRSLSASLSEP